ASGEVQLYAASADLLFEQINKQWSLLRRSLILYSQMALIKSLQLQARAALAIAAESAHPAAYLKIVEKNARRIARERVPYGDGWAMLLLSGSAAISGNTLAAIDYLTSAEQHFLTADMALYAAAARYRKGEVIGGDTGRTLIGNVEDWMY